VYRRVAHVLLSREDGGADGGEEGGREAGRHRGTEAGRKGVRHKEGRQGDRHCDSECVDKVSYQHIISSLSHLPRICCKGQREHKKSANCTWCCTPRHRRARLRSLLRGCCLRHLENERKIRLVSEVKCPQDRAAFNDRACVQRWPTSAAHAFLFSSRIATPTLFLVCARVPVCLWQL